MDSLIESALIKNFKDGKLPDFNVNVEVNEKTMVNIFAGLFIVGCALILVSKIFNIASR